MVEEIKVAIILLLVFSIGLVCGKVEQYITDKPSKTSLNLYLGVVEKTACDCRLETFRWWNSSEAKVDWIVVKQGIVFDSLNNSAYANLSNVKKEG